MQNIYKIIILLSTILCVPYNAKNSSYLMGIGYFGLATPKLSQMHSITEIWRDVAGDYGFLGGLPFSVKIANSTIQPELIYNRLSIQATRRTLIKTAPQAKASFQNDKSLAWSIPTGSFANREAEETVTKSVHILGLGMKWHYDLFSQKLQTFVGIVPFTGICLDYLQSESRFYASASPLLIEGGIKYLFYHNMHFACSGKYALLLKDQLKEHSISCIQAGFGFNF